MNGTTAGAREIVYVLERFPGDTLNFVYNEIRGLESEEFRVRIYSLLPCQVCPEEAEDFRARTTPVRPFGAAVLARALLHYLARRPLALLWAFLVLPFDHQDWTLRKAARTWAHAAVGVVFAWMLRDRPAHVHAHFAFKAATAAMLAARLNGTTFSFTAHGSATVHVPSRANLKSKVRRADFVVAVSDFNRRVMLDLCPDVDPDKIIVNRTGVLLDQFQPVPWSPDPEGTLRIVCVATLYPIKNHAGLLRACGILAERGVKFRLELVGKDDLGLGDGLRALAEELGIADRVVFHGGLDHGRVGEILAGADVAVLTSFSEGIPVSLMEAMAIGRPVVGPRVTGVPELIEEGVSGFLGDPDDPEEFAEAFRRLAESPDMIADLGMQGRRSVDERYDMRRNARRLAAEISRHLDGRAVSA